ncbi:O-antigen ligase family protein [Pseudolysinimonas sp.]|uniref:O-antigen ligase family protein n=1 Tax=Pseudolysinimonas sp. TaxID=2680009 RepID=UPI003F819621
MSEERTGPLAEFFGSPRLTQALATTGIGLAVLVYPARRLIGWPGLLSALVVLLVLMAVSFVIRRREIELHGLLPISLLAFLGWSLVSLVWSSYQWATAGGLVYLAAFTLVGVFVALSRDSIQVVRAFGDVLRFVLVVSLGVEIFAGLILQGPIPVLGVKGQIADLLPISGVVSTRNQLGFVAIVGAITFATQARTRSVSRLNAVSSLAVAGICIVLTFSPVVYGAAILVGVAAAILYGIRRVPASGRPALQILVLGLAAVAAVVTWLLRAPLIALFNASGVLNYRIELWKQILALIQQNFLQGFGWMGPWRTSIYPYSLLVASGDRPTGTALNAFLDVWLQLGIVGLVLFLGVAGLAFTRSWLLAGRRRSVVYAWPAATLLALLVISLAESSILAEFGWMTFVICCVKASQELSWRRALQPRE